MRKYVLFTFIFIMSINFAKPFSFNTESYSKPGQLQRFISEDFKNTNIAGLTVMKGSENFKFTLAEPIASFYNKISPVWLDLFLFRGETFLDQNESKENSFKYISTIIDKPVNVTSVHPGKLSGSSTGLAWTLAYISAKYPELTKDIFIAATGTITQTGYVNSVGSIEAKMQNSELNDANIIFVPDTQLVFARKTFYKYHDNPATVVYGVRNAKEAVNFICLYAKNNKQPCNTKDKVIKSSPANISLCNNIIANKKKIKCSWSPNGNDLYITN
jgi:hypothetical protein